MISVTKHYQRTYKVTFRFSIEQFREYEQKGSEIFINSEVTALRALLGQDRNLLTRRTRANEKRSLLFNWSTFVHVRESFRASSFLESIRGLENGKVHLLWGGGQGKAETFQPDIQKLCPLLML